MGFPQFPEKYANQTVYSAEDIVAYRGRLGRMPDLPRLEGVLLCLERGLPRKLRWKIPVHHAGSMNGEVYTIKKTGGRVAVMTGFGGGAPIVAELAEEFAVMGAKKIALMTWGGTLQSNLQAGDIVICDRAIRDEGTSQHYLPPQKHILACEALVMGLQNSLRRQGAAFSTGTTWTTDAPYRETVEEVRQYQSEGVMTVEMESAGLFAIGAVRGIQTASVVVVMDSLADLVWKVPERLEPISHSLEVVYRAAIETLAG